MFKKPQLYGLAEYFDNDRIRWVISGLAFLLCGAIPFLPVLTAAGRYDAVEINEVSSSLYFYWSGLGLDFYPILMIIYFIAGVLLLLWGLVKRPPFAGGIILTVLSAAFLLINLAAGSFVLVAVSMADLKETVSVSVWGWVSLGFSLANIVNLSLFLPNLKRGKISLN